MMKKISYILFLLMIALLTACSDDKQDTKANEETKEESLNVDKSLLNVEVTLPASMFEGEEDIDTMIADAEADGIDKVTKNDDGSVTLKMSKSKHKELMNEIETSIKESIKEMKTSGDYASIKDIAHNDKFTDFTVVVDKAAYENSMDGFVALGLGISGAMYQLYDGANPDDYKVTVSVKDEATDEVLDEMVYPDDLEDIETE